MYCAFFLLSPKLASTTNFLARCNPLVSITGGFLLVFLSPAWVHLRIKDAYLSVWHPSLDDTAKDLGLAKVMGFVIQTYARKVVDLWYVLLLLVAISGLPVRF